MRHYTTQDVLNAISRGADDIRADDCTGSEFDKLSDHIYRLIEKLIFKCLGSVHNARKRLAAEGLEEYLDLYLEIDPGT